MSETNDMDKVFELLKKAKEEDPTLVKKYIKEANEFYAFIFSETANKLLDEVRSLLSLRDINDLLLLSDEIMDIIEKKIPDYEERIVDSTTKRFALMGMITLELLNGRLNKEAISNIGQAQNRQNGIEDYKDCEHCPDKNYCIDSVYNKCRDFEPEEENVNANTLNEILKERGNNE